MNSLRELLRQWLAGESDPPPVTQLVGIRLVDCADGVARLELEAGRRHHNPMGIVHGGIFCDLADAAMGVAMASASQAGETFSTIELHASFFRPVREARLTAIGKTVRRGSNTGYLECEISDEQGRLVAKASSTCLIQSTLSEGERP